MPVLKPQTDSFLYDLWKFLTFSFFSSYVKIPERILKAYESGKPILGVHLKNATLQEITELQQWGTLFLFDYLTGNYDR